jgi:hypothetical protein
MSSRVENVVRQEPLFAIKAAVRKAEDLAAGDSITVRVHIV